MRLFHRLTYAVDLYLISNSRRVLYPAFVGLSVFFAYPSLVAYQDVASLARGPIAQRWLANLAESPGRTELSADRGSVVALAGTDKVITGSISAVPGRGVGQDGDDVEIMLAPKTQREPQRINRDGKGDRVVSTEKVLPPAHFTAGSVMERHSFLEPLEPARRYELAFVKRLPFSEAIEIASLFHLPDDEPVIDTDLPVTVASLVRESAPHVLAYGEEEGQSQRSPFAALLDEPLNWVPRLGKYDHAWAAQPLPLSAFGEREQNCLTAGIYFEARGEPVRGQAAVAQVILNRVKSPTFPNSICGVVYQNKKWRNRCQFSFACDGVKERVSDPRRWDIARYVARETSEGRIWLTQVGSSTHYHATYVQPRWARRMKKVGRIGLHVFYRTFGGGWS